jgi:hypothetical protein
LSFGVPGVGVGGYAAFIGCLGAGGRRRWLGTVIRSGRVVVDTADG